MFILCKEKTSYILILTGYRSLKMRVQNCLPELTPLDFSDLDEMLLENIINTIKTLALSSS